MIIYQSHNIDFSSPRLRLLLSRLSPNPHSASELSSMTESGSWRMARRSSEACSEALEETDTFFCRAKILLSLICKPGDFFVLKETWEQEIIRGYGGWNVIDRIRVCFALVA